MSLRLQSARAAVGRKSAAAPITATPTVHAMRRPAAMGHPKNR
jgi:hypothetical protein